jgi:crotonobetainyl-CoA:carnitine CoA-transferase CaiB-like acyl-CoA transferase
MSGISDATGEADRPPTRIRPAMIDYCTGVSTAFAIAAALFRREKTGCGEKIDVALLDIALYAMSPYITHFKRTGELIPRSGSAHPATVPNQNFETKDGFVCIAAGNDPMWKRLCKGLNIEEVSKNPRYETQALRLENRQEVVEIINRETRKYSSRELEEKLLVAGVACGQVRNVAEIIQEPHVQQRGILEEFDHPVLGQLVALKTPIFLSGKSSPLRRSRPMLGENTGEVLKELGYSESAIQDLIAKGVALQHKP